MPGYFFDSNTLVKLHRQEAGTLRVDQIVNTPGNSILDLPPDPPELVSALAIKVRTQAIVEIAPLAPSSFNR